MRRLFGLIIFVLITAAQPLYAAQAPVYDADSYPPFDGESPQVQDLPDQPSSDEVASSHSNRALSPQSSSSQTMSTSQRLSRIEQQFNLIQETNARLSSLQQEVQTLRGQVEDLSHKLQQLQNQQRTQSLDMDKRLSDKDQKVAVSSTVEETEDNPVTPKQPIAKVTQEQDKLKSTQPNNLEEQQIYQTAYNLIKTKKYNDAVKTLQGMLQKYPNSQFSGNAHYWLGELYGLMGKNNEALEQFLIVVRNYPKSPRYPDAELKIGMLYAAQSKWSEAKAAFKTVTSRYPGSASARLASEQLKQLKEAGH